MRIAPSPEQVKVMRLYQEKSKRNLNERKRERINVGR